MTWFRQFVLLPLHRFQPAGVKSRTDLCNESGNALIELGFVLSILGVPLLLGVGYFGFLLLDSIELANAAHAGAEYGMQSSTFAEENTGIAAAAQNETSHFGTLTVTPSIFYVCSTGIGGTQYSTQTAANSACTGGTSHSLEMIQVVASASVTPPVTLPGFQRTVILSSPAVMEVEE